MSPRRSEAVVGCESIDDLDPAARTLVLEIIGMFVTDALSESAEVDAGAQTSANRQPCSRAHAVGIEPQLV